MSVCAMAYDNDTRRRCEKGHLVCDGCAACACDAKSEGFDYTAFPTGRLRVSTDSHGETLCRECRYMRYGW